ncbi:MAG: methyltransferase domain-containing protein [Acidobacteriota bacterium]|nr:methyltransferase domain-containing protein [Acidobacteriota bacterium]
MQPRRPELLDSASLAPSAARRALDDLGRVNRWTLGFRTTLRTLLPRIGTGKTTSVVDLGTGSGELLGRLGRICERRGSRLRALGVDRKLDHLAHGRRRGFLGSAVAADVTALPFRDSSFDWTISALLLHHFDPPMAREVLSEMVRVGKHGAVITDLEQGALTAAGARLLPLLGVGSIAALDGRISAGQAWRLDEIPVLAKDHRILELRRRFPCRFSLVLAAR